MRLNKKTTQLICELERIIGNECYNPNSYDGWNDLEGCEFRYPVTYEDIENQERRTRLTIQNLDKTKVGSIHYKFGSNHLYIGMGIKKVLEYLEDKYDIDFNQLSKGK